MAGAGRSREVSRWPPALDAASFGVWVANGIFVRGVSALSGIGIDAFPLVTVTAGLGFITDVLSIPRFIERTAADGFFRANDKRGRFDADWPASESKDRSAESGADMAPTARGVAVDDRPRPGNACKAWFGDEPGRCRD